MLFDLMCSLQERVPELGEFLPREVLDDTKLFSVDGKLPDAERDSEIIFPYDNVAFEHGVMASHGKVKVDSCVLLSQSKYLGVMGRYLGEGAVLENAVYVISSYPNIMTDGKRETVFMVGVTYREADAVKSMPIYSAYVNGGRELYGVKAGRDVPDNMWEWYRSVMPYTLEIVKAISSPKLFVVAEGSAKGFGVGKRVARSHQRPRHTVLNLGQIQKRYGLSGTGTGASKVAHPRRAHVRILRSGRYGGNVGKRVRVRSTWVGPTEARVGNKVYRVLLDD